MNHFDKTHKSEKPLITEAEAVFNIFLSIIYSDGKMSDEEINEFSFYFGKIKVFKNHTITDLFPGFQKIFKQCDYNSEKVVEMVCPYIASENRLPVFIYCCDFVFSNLTEKANEYHVLEKVMNSLTLDEKIAENVMHIMKRKNVL